MPARQFEYLRVKRHDLRKKTFLNLKLSPSNEEVSEALNEFGKQGWELVTVEQSDVIGDFYLFKRELP